MPHSRIWVYLIIASSILMMVSGSVFMSLQHWAINESPSALSNLESLFASATSNQVTTKENVQSEPVREKVAHRVMLSTAWEKKEKPVQEHTPAQTVKTHVTTNVATRVSSMPNRAFTGFDVQPKRLPTPSSDLQQSVKPVAIRPAVLTQEKPPAAIRSSSAQQPSFVIYQDELVIEFPKAIASTQNIKKAITRLLLSRHLPRDGNLLSNDRLNYVHKPYFYRKVLDENKQAIRYPKQAYDYINYLLKNAVEEVSDDSGEYVEIHIPLHETGLKGPAKTYQAWVDNYASKFDINPALVYAVMETESGFNPKAISSSNAIGLMQLKPDTAGKDVYQYVDQKPGQPSKWDLFDSEKNIRMGVAYLSLLKHDYLSDIRNDKIKQMVTISSYNGGIKTVLGLFGKTPDKAIARLNRLNPKQVYRTLRYQHQSDETRRYLDKVLRAESRYKALLDDA